MPMQPPKTPQQVEDDPTIRETFVDGPVGANYVNGNLHISFYTVRVDHNVPNATVLPQQRRVALRLVIPIGGAIESQNMIGNMVQILRDQGLMQTKAVLQGPATRQ